MSSSIKPTKRSRIFCFKIAFLPKITIKAAEQLTGLPNADRILSALSRNNYFTERHYSTAPVYQFHPLYREFLMTRARETFSPEALSTLLHQAAILLEQEGQTEAAVSLLREIGDWKEMSTVIIAHAPEMLKQGRHQTLREWLESLPASLAEGQSLAPLLEGHEQSALSLPTAQPAFGNGLCRVSDSGRFYRGHSGGIGCDQCHFL